AAQHLPRHDDGDGERGAGYPCAEHLHVEGHADKEARTGDPRVPAPALDRLHDAPGGTDEGEDEERLWHVDSIGRDCNWRESKHQASDSGSYEPEPSLHHQPEKR